MRTSLVCSVAALVVGAATSLADYTTGAVTGLTARQRYPWNGKVDISFTLSGPETQYYISIAATNAVTGAEIPICTLRDARGNAINALKFAPGNVSLIWDAGIDAPGIVVDTLALSVVTAPLPWRGMVQLWENGPYWAMTNIGAEEPHEYGLYFWWGDVVGYRFENSAWIASDGSSRNFSFEGSLPVYNKSAATLQSEGWVVLKDGTYVLAPEHDAARVQWGGTWRMPTKQELSNLNNKCDWTWTTQNGVNGYIVCGRDDYASVSIFLPAAGWGYEDHPASVGSGGWYWSSVPYSTYHALSLHFESDYHSTVYNANRYDRSRGRSVRPIQGLTE